MTEKSINRGEFNAAMEAVREQVAGVKEDVRVAVSDLRADMVERFGRVETLQQMASSQALKDAEERGAIKQRVDSLEQKENHRDNRTDRLQVGLILTFVTALLGLALRLWKGV